MTAQAHGASILIVDDEEDNRDILRRRLTRAGHKVSVAEDGTRALALLAESRFDVVLLDIMMPGMSGLEVLAAIRRRHPITELPVIMASALAEGEDVVRALELGANDYVTKPIDFAVVLARINTQLKTRARPGASPEVPASDADTSPAPASSPAPPAPGVVAAGGRDLTGQVLSGKYRLDQEIGKGGFGTVYRAFHFSLRRPVAVKVLSVIGASHAHLVRFSREGISACKVDHPNAVKVMDLDVMADGTPYLVMELLDGHDLRAELTPGAGMTLARAAAVLVPVCDLLCAAHASGVVHRDLKPANIFLHRSPGGEVVKVVDFGLAKIVGDSRGQTDEELTRDGQIVGSPAYIAPERWLDQPADGRSDVYSLGVILFLLLGGRLPFKVAGELPASIAYQHVHVTPPPLLEVSPAVPQAVADVVDAALAKDPGERPSVPELARALAGAAGIDLPPACRGGGGAAGAA